MRQRILLLDAAGFLEEALALMRTEAEVDTLSLDRSELLAQVSRYEGLFVRFSHKIDAEIIGRAERLKFIATNATGTDHIDTAEAARRGIRVLSLRGEQEFLQQVSATAELTWALLLALVRRIPFAFDDVKRGRWDRERFVGRDLMGRRLGVMGLGRLGSKVARYGAAFGMPVGYFDPVPKRETEGLTCFPSPEDLFAWADVLTIHIPLDNATSGIVDRKLLGLLSPGSILVNTSRGAVLDEPALLEMLASGHIAGAALDVLVGELDDSLMSGHPLVRYASTHENLIITPHIGGASSDAWARTECFIANRVVEFLRQSR